METGGSFEHLIKRRKTSPTLYRAPSIRSRLSNAPLRPASPAFFRLRPVISITQHSYRYWDKLRDIAFTWLADISSCSALLICLTLICIRFQTSEIPIVSMQSFIFGVCIEVCYVHCGVWKPSLSLIPSLGKFEPLNAYFRPNYTI